MKRSWLSSKAERRGTAETGFGIFAIAQFELDEPIAVWAGRLFSGEDFAAVAPEFRSKSVQVGADCYLVPWELFPGDFVNHSCDPNAGLAGDRTLVARRLIESGEEITYDYAMTDTTDYDEFTCRCGVISCRGLVRGSDWKDPELRSRYRDSLSVYIEQMILDESDC